MSVRIRLKRMGGRSKPFFRIVVINSRNPHDGKAIEYIGTYDPIAGGKAVLKHERYQYWTSVGAIPSDTVASLVPRAVEYSSTLPQPETAAVAAE